MLRLALTRRQQSTPHSISGRGKVLIGLCYLGLLGIIGRLFFWQVIQGSILKAAAHSQYQRTVNQSGQRGRIFSSDGYLLVGNTTQFQVVGYPYLVDKPVTELVDAIEPLVLSELVDYREASEEAVKRDIQQQLHEQLTNKLNNQAGKWVSLFPAVSEQTMKQLSSLNLSAIDFAPQARRLYPEASLAAHITGFVGKDQAGQPVGYFGIEGALEKELGAKSRTSVLSTDAFGLSLFHNQSADSADTNGRDVVLTVRRDIQYMARELLSKGMEQYGAKAGEIVILDPQTGKILAMVSLPTYDPANYGEYEANLYKNPVLSSLFEPGSIMKTLTVSAGIDTGAITPDTTCPRCDGPRVIDKYTIKTWNEEYHPNITMKDALAKSDNTAMIFVAEEVGMDRMREYYKQFGMGEKIQLDLQEDNPTPFPDKWGPVELATRSFGQGISANSLQMIRAVAAIANQGVMMQPRIVEKVIEPSGKELPVEPKELRRVISEETARDVTGMMVYAAQSGEAQWTYSKTHTVAAKTGTSQIPDEQGGYQADATIATFVGFAPPEQPRFVMLVKLVEPQSSPWAAETAAPLWYRVAERLFLLLNIPADR